MHTPLTPEEREQIERDSHARTMQKLYESLSDADQALVDQLVASYQALLPYEDMPGPEFRQLPACIEHRRLDDIVFSQKNSERLYMCYTYRCSQPSPEVKRMQKTIPAQYRQMSRSQIMRDLRGPWEYIEGFGELVRLTDPQPTTVFSGRLKLHVQRTTQGRRQVAALLSVTGHEWAEYAVANDLQSDGTFVNEDYLMRIYANEGEGPAYADLHNPAPNEVS
jgi:hypothetical protein